MNLIPQLILAARGKGVEKWMNTLFVVVVAIFWAVGGLLKAKADKAKRNQQQGIKPETKPHPATAKGLQGQNIQQPRQPAQRREHHPAVQPPRREVSRPEPVAPKLAAKSEPFVQLEGIEPLEDKYIGVPVETQPEYLVELLSDYADPDKLKRAILHYEILGKPLSLRETSESI